MAAVGNGQFKMVKLLIDRNARMDIKDNSLTTAIEYAISGKHPNIVKFLKNIS